MTRNATGWYRLEAFAADGSVIGWTTSTQARGVLSFWRRYASRAARMEVGFAGPQGDPIPVATWTGATWVVRPQAPDRLRQALDA